MKCRPSTGNETKRKQEPLKLYGNKMKKKNGAKYEERGRLDAIVKDASKRDDTISGLKSHIKLS
jgi:hypothetical protein